MSREFGSYSAGYFDTQIDNAADDLAGGHDALSRAWAPWFEAFRPVARAIASSEAYDSGPAAPILATIAQLPALEAALSEIRRHVQPYEAVAEDAVRAALSANPDRGDRP